MSSTLPSANRTNDPEAQPRAATGHFQDVALVLFCLLPLIAPLGWQSQRVIAFKGNLAIMLGALCWIALAANRSTMWPRHRNTPALVLLALFALAAITTALFASDGVTPWLGSTLYRVGILALAAFVGTGLVLRTLGGKRLLTLIYVTAVILAAVSLPYDLLRNHHLTNLSGPLLQSDALAAWLGAGFLVGLTMFSMYPARAKLLVAAQTGLLAALLLTQTRAVLAILAFLTVIYGLWVVRSRRLLVGTLCAIVIIALSLLPAFKLTATRVNDAHYLRQSASYRLHLQAAGLNATRNMPLLGFGPGGLIDALACSPSMAQDLQDTCKQGFIFDSSHNIFLDHVLEFGWLGGLLVLTLALLAISRGLISPDPVHRTAALTLLLIALYYLTNVTTVDLELLFWVLLTYLLFIKVPWPKSSPAQNLTHRLRRPLIAMATASILLIASGAVQSQLWPAHAQPVSAMTLLVNRAHPLPKTYRPPHLVLPSVAFANNTVEEERYLRPEPAAALEHMFAQAKRARITFILTSGYRSYSAQQQLFATQSHTSTGGQTTADVAPPGFSEHQIGLAADISPDTGFCHEPCQATPDAQAWLRANAYRFGFILRYPQGQEAVTGYPYEPWHMRYVGVPAAQKMHDARIPTLEQYLQSNPKSINVMLKP